MKYLENRWQESDPPPPEPKLRYLTTFLLLLLLSDLFGTAVFAQPKETPDSVRFKALGCLYRSIIALNHRNVRFKALQDELEDMHPLEPQSLDSVRIKTNIEQAGKYLKFLESHRSEINKNLRLFSDSVKGFETLMNKQEEKRSLENFLKAYKEESSAFILYSQYLSVMITDIRFALVFLQTVPMERNGNDVTFNTDKSANEKYLNFESKVSADRMKVDEAIEKSISLTEKENKIIQETTTLLNN